MPEPLFWRTMNPAKLTALYDSYFNVSRPEVHPARREEKPQQSLRDYMRGG